MIILGIETSCDETGIAIYDSSIGILCEYTYSQKIHYIYGGTVPELASKEHFKKIIKLIVLTLKNRKLNFSDINCISYTIGPGLKSSLLIGVIVGKALSFFLSIPSNGVNHLKSHIFISFLFSKKLEFPFLVLFFSGGHSFLLEIAHLKSFVVLGRTLDDSLGEAFDKVARALKIFPFNGKMVEFFSERRFLFSNLNYPKFFDQSFDFSFSGIKTAVIRDIKGKILDDNLRSNISYNFQNTTIKVILRKCIRLFLSKKYNGLILAGGVSANKNFRLVMNNYSYFFGLKLILIPIKYCTDNGVMISFFGFISFVNNSFDRDFNVLVKPNLDLN